MSAILISGSNKIADILIDHFELEGLTVYRDSDSANYKKAKLDIIIDANNAEGTSEDSSLFLHNSSGVKELIDLSEKSEALFLFLFKEDSQSNKPESILFTAMDIISTYGKSTNTLYANIQVEDISGKDINTSEPLERFIENITHDEDLDVKSDLNDIYIINQKDFISGILKIIEELKSTNKPKTYTLLPEEPITEIELAHYVKDLTDLEVKIDYESEDDFENTPSDLYIEANYPLGWQPKISLEQTVLEVFDDKDIPIPLDAITEISEEQRKMTAETLAEEAQNVKTYQQPAKVSAVPPQTNPTKPAKRKGSFKKVALTAFLLAISLLIPSISYSIQATQGLIALNNSVKELKIFDIQKANISSIKAIEKLDNLPATPKPILITFKIFEISEEDISILLNSSKNVAEIVQNVSKMDLLSLETNENILGVSTMTSDKTEIDRTVELIDSVKSNIQSLKTKNHALQLQIDKISRDLNDNRDKLIKFKNIQSALPVLLGSNDPQKYLILFQNSNELRATGGFIGSYGIINVQNGKISIEKIDDIYNPDGQLELNEQGIFAPAAFTKAFGVDYIYIRDANWDPDFKKSATQIESLYEKATGEKVDGVIGLDLIFIKNLLKTTGNLKLPTYNETITADNFFSKTQFYSEKDFFPGSNQKPAFLNDLSMALIEKILSTQDSNKDLVLSVFNSLETKNILIYHNDAKVLSALQQNNWAGGLDAVNDDYLLVVDSNVGANKANLFIKRSIEFESYKPQRDSGYVRKVRIKYQHVGRTDIWPGGDYLNHLRLYVPKEVTLNAAYVIDNHGARTNISRSVDVFAYADKSIYETDLLIKVGETKTIEFEYESAKKYFDDNFINLTIQKQPGTENDILTILYHFPYGTTNYENDTLKIDSNLSEDRSFQIPL